MGLLITLFISGYAIIELDDWALSFGLIGTILFYSLKLYRRKNKTSKDYIHFSLIITLCIIYFLKFLNIGSIFIVGLIHYVFVLVLIIFIAFQILYFLPDKIFQKHKNPDDRKPFRELVFTIMVLLLIYGISIPYSFGLSYKIRDYKYERYKSITINNYYQNKEKFHACFQALKSLPTISYLEFGENNVSINIYDTTLTDSFKISNFHKSHNDSTILPLYYSRDYDYNPNIDFLDSNLLTLTYPEGIDTFNCNWYLNIFEVDYNESIYLKAIAYLGIMESKLDSIKEDLLSINCDAFSIDQNGVISIFYSGFHDDKFSYVLGSTIIPEKDIDSDFEILDDKVNWWHQDIGIVDYFRSYYMFRYNI